MTLKEKYDNFIYYYKWHTIVGLFAVVVLIITLQDCAANARPDLNLTVFSTKYVEYSKLEQAMATVEPLLLDSNADNKKRAGLRVLTTNGTDADMYEKTMVMSTQIADSDIKLYIMSRELFEKYDKFGLFGDMSEFIGKNKLEGAYQNHGVVLDNSALLKKYGTNPSGLVAGVRVKMDGLAVSKKANDDVLLENAYIALAQLSKAGEN